jgi:hypothetical protein
MFAYVSFFCRVCVFDTSRSCHVGMFANLGRTVADPSPLWNLLPHCLSPSTTIPALLDPSIDIFTTPLKLLNACLPVFAAKQLTLRLLRQATNPKILADARPQALIEKNSILGGVYIQPFLPSPTSLHQRTNQAFSNLGAT